MKNYRILILFIASALLANLGQFFIPFVWEAGSNDVFFYIQGAKTMLDGGTLYKDFGEIKPPLVFFVYAGLIKLFGYQNILMVIKLFFALLTALTGFVLYLAAATRVKKNHALIAGLSYVILASIYYKLWPLNVMTIANLPLMLFLWLLLKESELRPRIFFTAGLLLGLAFTVSTNLIFYAAMVPLLALLNSGNVKKTLQLSLVSFPGFLVFPAIFFLYFHLNGSLADFYWWNVEWAGIYGGSVGFFKRLGSFFSGFGELWMWAPLYVLFILGMGNLKKSTDKNGFRFFMIMTVLLGAALLSRMVFARGAPRYYIYLLPVLVLISAYGYERFKANWMRLAAVLVLAGGFVFSNYQAFQKSYERVAEKRKPLIEYIRNNSGEQDKILVWFEGYELYYYSGRSMAGNIYSTSNHLNDDKVWAKGGCRGVDKPWRSFIDRVKTDRPALLIDLLPDFGSWNGVSACTEILKYEKEFKDYVNLHYFLDRTINSVHLWNTDSKVNVWKRKN